MGFKGRHHTEETKRKISEAKKGKNNPNYGKHLSEETKRKISEANKGHTAWNKGLTENTDERVRRNSEANRGKHRSEEFKRKTSKAKKGNHCSEETKLKISEANKGRIPWNKGEPFSEETRRKMSKAKKGHITWMKGKRHSEEAKAKIREARLKQVFPAQDTSIEVAMQSELRRRGINFDTHVSLLGKYQIDIFIDPNIVVECKGDYWHSKEFKNGEVWARDCRREQELEEAGYSVYSFWGHEIRASPEHCVDKIELR